MPDLIGPGLKLLFVGINPGLWTAATQTHFAHPGNRFYPALRMAGIISRDIPSTGMTDADREHLIERGIGISNVVHRATARADELTREEYVDGGARLQELVRRIEVPVVAIAGIGAYRSAFRLPTALPGLQPPGVTEEWGGAEIWVVPNPSGLNAHETVATLAAKYAEPARAAGIL
ncbi:mismatch-specific DNA-glycosylase [Nocardioides sp. Kera G14]|uniref:mismatch-specific DNA-glycosylase n=1 Tax=Nocardioides sp. Kera G14 TaxID=2884264 RepID=UPI001D0FDBB9|nr:mismatch-specific DNA-glycosylase [Nocardioides sp. Kera G14]UDY23081.1 mismatch-specific DNA-glycosylase [Nocardioides sp. Kera G14]